MHFQKHNWKNYNKQLVNRGKIHFWVEAKVFKRWEAKKRKKNGYPFVYGDLLILDDNQKELSQGAVLHTDMPSDEEASVTNRAAQQTRSDRYRA